MSLKLTFSSVAGDILVDLPDLEAAFTGIAAAIAAKPAGNKVSDDEKLGAAILTALEPITDDLQNQIAAATSAPAATPAKTS